MSDFFLLHIWSLCHVPEGAHVSLGLQLGRILVKDSEIQLLWSKDCPSSSPTDTDGCVAVDCGQLQGIVHIQSAENECKCCTKGARRSIHQIIKGKYTA